MQKIQYGLFEITGQEEEKKNENNVQYIVESEKIEMKLLIGKHEYKTQLEKCQLCINAPNHHARQRFKYFIYYLFIIYISKYKTL